jgi:hypothetical protein
MAQFLKSGSQGRLLGSLERFLKTEEPEFRSQAVLHPSSMAKASWCPAAGFWQLLWDDAGKTPPGEINPLQRQNIFDEGHYIHDKWQQRFWRQGVLYGNWTCMLCPLPIKGLVSPPWCPAGHERKFLKYAEVPLESPAHRIAGHADGWIQDDKGTCLIEIKSVGSGTYRFDAQHLIERHGDDFSELWKNTKRPFLSHIMQGQIYLHLAHLMHGDSAPQEMVYIYESKVHQQYKEFVVPRDSSLVASRFSDATDIVRRITEKKGPPECVTGHSCSECKPYAAA